MHLHLSAAVSSKMIDSVLPKCEVELLENNRKSVADEAPKAAFFNNRFHTAKYLHHSHVLMPQ
jgi:hypothetical protein